MNTHKVNFYFLKLKIWQFKKLALVVTELQLFLQMMAFHYLTKSVHFVDSDFPMWLQDHKSKVVTGDLNIDF